MKFTHDGLPLRSIHGLFSGVKKKQAGRDFGIFTMVDNNSRYANICVFIYPAILFYIYIYIMKYD